MLVQKFPKLVRKCELFYIHNDYSITIIYNYNSTMYTFYINNKKFKKS